MSTQSQISDVADQAAELLHEVRKLKECAGRSEAGRYIALAVTATEQVRHWLQDAHRAAVEESANADPGRALVVDVFPGSHA